MLIIIIAFQ